MKTFDLETSNVSELNQSLHAQADQVTEKQWQVLNPKGTHNIAVGLDQALAVDVQGHAGYFCAGMNKSAQVIVHGNAGARCGISMKGVDNVVKGDVGHMSCFMGQSGSLVVCGDAGEVPFTKCIYMLKVRLNP